MLAKLEKKKLILETNIDSSVVKQSKQRPNIEHLIKRIIVERRKQERKNLTVFMGILLIIGCTIMFSYYS